MKPTFEDQRETIYHVDPAHPENPALPTLRTEEMMLNMGPQHPSTHGVLKVVLALEGERIVKATTISRTAARWKNSSALAFPLAPNIYGRSSRRSSGSSVISSGSEPRPSTSGR